MKLILMLSLIIALIGCDIEKGECVLISGISEGFAIKAEYLKFSDGAHWYFVDGEIKSVPGFMASVTSCDN